jgi:hypothetical protein
VYIYVCIPLYDFKHALNTSFHLHIGTDTGSTHICINIYICVCIYTYVHHCMILNMLYVFLFIYRDGQERWGRTDTGSTHGSTNTRISFGWDILLHLYVFIVYMFIDMLVDMCVYVNICMYVGIPVHIYMCISPTGLQTPVFHSGEIFIYIHVFIHGCVYIHTYVYVDISTHLYMYINVCIFTYTQICMSRYLNMHILFLYDLHSLLLLLLIIAFFFFLFYRCFCPEKEDTRCDNRYIFIRIYKYLYACI